MNKVQCLAISAFFVLLAIIRFTQANPMYPQIPENGRPVVEVEDPELVLEMLSRIGQSILRAKHDGANSKRVLDFGTGRGFSSGQTAKHIMGLAAANLAVGPGKRKRTEITLDYPGLDSASISGNNLPNDYWYIKQ